MKYIISFITLFLFANIAFSQNSTDETIEWNDGKKVHRLKVVSNMLVEFNTNNNDNNSIITSKDSSSQVVNRGSNFKVWKTTQKNVNELSKKSESGITSRSNSNTHGTYSPVFRNKSGQLVALPGNIFIKFKKSWSDEKIRDWADKKKLVIVRKISNFHNMYLIKSDPGISTLELVNQLAGEEGIVSISPNWWKQYTSR
jgi:predicted nuclease of predicted toxin-antitoxin system